MTRLPVLATVAATIVVVVGGLLLINRPSDRGVGAPTTSPSASAVSPSGSPAAMVPLPDALRARWMGSERPVPGILSSAGTVLNLTAASAFITQSAPSDAHFLDSVASNVGDGQFRLETVVTGGGACSKGDIGLYSWSVSTRGRILSVTEVRDDCSTRLAAVPGVWWLEACKNAQNYCLGDLDAGAYKSQYITPRLDAGAGALWAADYGALTYTVPDGWANSADFPERFSLTPSADYALAEVGAEDGAHRIDLHRQYAASAQNADCTSEELTSVPRTVNGLVNWIHGLPSLTSSAPTAITIDGHAGQWLDVGVSPSWKASCPGETKPIALFLTETGSSPAGDSFAIVAGDRVRLIFLDLGDGDIVMVDIYGPDVASFDGLVAQALPIIQSFHFE